MGNFDSKGFVLASAFFLAACSLCRAEQTAPAAGGTSTAVVADDGRTIEFKEKAVVGTQHYRSNDAGLEINLPHGFNVNGEYSIYESDLSSRAATISLGIGKDWDDEFLGFTYSWTPLANNYRSQAVGATVGYFTPSKDFRTTIGGTFNATRNIEFVRPMPEENQDSLISIDVWQMTATLNVKQQIHDTKLTLDFGKSIYDHKIAGLAGKISPDSTRL